MGFLGAHFEVGRRRVKLPPCLILVRIMLGTWNLVRQFTHICSFRKYNFQYQGTLNFADFCWCQHLFCKKSAFFLAKMVSLLKAIVWELCKRVFSSVFTFCKIKVTANENVSFAGYSSEIQLLDCSKLAINWGKKQWRHNLLTWCRRLDFLTSFYSSYQV